MPPVPGGPQLSTHPPPSLFPSSFFDFLVGCGGTGVFVAVGLGVKVNVIVGVDVKVEVGVCVKVGVAVKVGIAVFVNVGVGVRKNSPIFLLLTK